MPEPAVNIVGVGNALMGDDGAGIAAVEALSRCGIGPRARLHDAGLAVSDVLGRLDPSEPLVVLDAVRGGGPAGSVYRLRLDALGGGAAAAAGPPVSLHELSVAPALQLEALSGRAFEDVVVFGVEPEAVGWGQGLSAAVAEGVDRLVEAVMEYLAGRAPSPAGHTGRAEPPAPQFAGGPSQ